MDTNKLSPFSSNLFRFYAKCFSFPYDELFYELHHLYRTLEQNIYNDFDFTYLQQSLEILNNFQGIDFKDMREEYILLFSVAAENEPLCPFFASDFMSRHAKHINTDRLVDLFFEVALPFDENESTDSIINLLEYFSVQIDSFLNEEILEEDLVLFYHDYLINWLPLFCDTLVKASSFDFYKEIADGLKAYLIGLH